MHTAMPMIRATWLPPLSESLPNRVITIANRPMSTASGMQEMSGCGSLRSVIYIGSDRIRFVLRCKFNEKTLKTRNSLFENTWQIFYMKSLLYVKMLVNLRQC